MCETQNSVFSCLPKGISSRRYSHMLFLPTPASADLPIVCAKLGVFMPCQKSFQIEDIQVYYSCPLLKAQSLQCYVQTSSNWVFWCPPQGISSRRYAHNVIPAHPWKPRLFNFMQDSVFPCFPKGISKKNSNICYSCPPLAVQICQLYVQNLAFSCLPKSISNRRYSNILFPPAPESLETSI